MAKASDVRATGDNTDELTGLAWLELAEVHTRDAGDERLALALVYLRGSLTGDGRLPSLNLAEALRLLTAESSRALSLVLERDGAIAAVSEHTATDDAARRIRLLASGWRWLATMGSANTTT